MSALGKIMVGLLAAIAAVALFAGFGTPGGQTFVDNVQAAAASFWTWTTDQIGSLSDWPTAGNFALSAGIAVGIFLFLLAVIPGFRQGRNFAIGAVVFTALGFLLYFAPSLGS